MFVDNTPEGNSPDSFVLPTYRQETLRHILLGDYGALIDGISHLVSLGYCDPIAWSAPIPTGRSGEYISVMTRRRGVTRP
jgi:hypothetical protein